MTTKIRASKFRHLFGTPNQLRDTYGDLLVGSVSGESNVIKVNKTFFALPWTKTGSVAIVPLTRFGTVPEDTPVFTYHCPDAYATQINELNFSPHDDFQLATAGNDGGAAVWRIPSEEGLSQDVTQPELRINASDKRLLSVDYHPLASGVLITAAADKKIALWDLEAGGAQRVVLPDAHKGLVSNWSWNYEGSLLATSCKDKKLRIFDPRSDSVVAEVDDHQSAKSSRVQWMGKVDKIFTAGYTKTSERELAAYDPRNMSKRIHTEKLSTSSSTALLFADEDANLLFVAGKGDGTITYLEVTDEAPFVYPLSEYKAKTPQNGLAMLPKTSCNVMSCEIARFLKLSGNRAEPIRFEVPRAQAGDYFHDDLYPDTWDEKATMSAEAWFGGENNPRNLISLSP